MPELIQITCPLCKSKQAHAWASENNYTAVKCENCGFVYVNPRPSEDSITEQNQIGYHGTKSDAFRSIRLLRINKVRAFRKRLKSILKSMDLLSKKIEWLDVGAGSGELLYSLKKLLAQDSTLEGIEPSKAKLAIAQKSGLHITDTTLDQIDKKYDVVSLINVFSHLPEPQEFIHKLQEKVKPNGYLLLVTGNGGDITPSEYPDNFFFPDHLVFAGEQHIKKIFTDSGFSVFFQKQYKYFLPENIFIRILKTVWGGSALFNRGSFRSLWFVGQKTDKK